MSWRFKSMHPFLLPLTPRLSSSSAKPKGKPRTDQQHRLFIALEALFFGTLSPGGNARDDDGDFANMQEVGLSPPFVDRRSPEEKEAAAKRKIKREAKKAAKAAAKEAKKAAFESLSPEQQLKKKGAQAVKTKKQKEKRADQTEGEKEEDNRKRKITQKAWRQPRKDDDNLKRRDARAGRSKEEKEEDNRKRKIAQTAYRHDNPRNRGDPGSEMRLDPLGAFGGAASRTFRGL